MTDKQMQAVLAHVKSGGLVKLRSHGYVNDFARLDDVDGVWTIEDNVFAPVRLTVANFYDLYFFKRVEIKA